MNNTPKFLVIASDHQTQPITGQCDCACAEPARSAMTFSSVGLPELIEIAPNTLTLSLPNKNKLLFNPLAGRLAVVNQPTFDLWYAFSQKRLVSEALSMFPHAPYTTIADAIRQLLELALLQPTPHLLATRCISQPQTLIAWLHITNNCNLRCSYCYLDKTNEAMCDETGRFAIQAIFRSARANGFCAVKIKYAGGEPTLNFPLILQLHQQAQTLARQSSIKLDEVILSNGIGWTLQMIESVKTRDIRVMISLDGIGAAHDAQRAFINGQGSFAPVVRTVERLLAHNVIPDISITISRHNVDGLPDLMAWMLERDLPFSFNFYRESECAACARDLLLSEQQIISGMKAAYTVIEANLPHRNLSASLLDRANLAGPHHHTCAVGNSYLVIDHHGQVAKCQMDITHPVTNIRTADPLAVIRTGQTGLRNMDVDKKEDCRDCTWRYWCAGGCPLQTFRATGRYDMKSPNCGIYQALFPQVLRLEGLRLLKYSSSRMGAS